MKLYQFLSPISWHAAFWKPDVARLAPPAAAATASPFTLCRAPVIDEWNQRQVSSALDRARQRALVFGARATPPARLDLAKIGDELSQQRDVFVVDMHDPGFADRIHTPAREAPTAAAFPASVPVPASLSVPSL
jgi:hypothetical protein